MAQGVPGLPVAIIAAGGVLAWSGIYDKKLADVLGTLLKGSQPKGAPTGTPFNVSLTSDTSGSSGSVTPAGGNPSGGSAAANQAMGKMMATAYGWGSGAEWTALNNLVMSESGWSATITNPSSGAA